MRVGVAMLGVVGYKPLLVQACSLCSQTYAVIAMVDDTCMLMVSIFIATLNSGPILPHANPNPRSTPQT